MDRRIDEPSSTTENVGDPDSGVGRSSSRHRGSLVLSNPLAIQDNRGELPGGAFRAHTRHSLVRVRDLGHQYK